MSAFYDLHIHSCLSPCAEKDMTPNNIVNMSLLKGLDIIAVSDHQSGGNARAVAEVGRTAGLVVIPAMEFCTNEEIHLLSLFPDIESLLRFEQELSAAAPILANRPDIFGEQLLCDAEDEVTGHIDRMLLAAGPWDTGESLARISRLGGVVVPAHVDRDSYGMIAVLGTLPEEYGFGLMELSGSADETMFRAAHPELKHLSVLRNSDAHRLWEISEPVWQLPIDRGSVEQFWNWIRKNGKRHE